MKIRIGELRLMIRETLLREMPLADITEPTTQYSDYDFDDDDFEEKSNLDRKQIHRFFKTPKFHDDAVRLLKNLSVPIYLVPAHAYGDGQRGGTRIYNSDVDNLRTKYDGIVTKNNVLEQYGISPEKSKEILSAVDHGAAVFIIRASMLASDNLPTLWMTVHALFDTEPDIDKKIIQTSVDIAQLVQENNEEEIIQCLTMKSARDGVLDNSADVAAEIMCQAILTTQGFTYKESEDEEINDTLKQISSMIKNSKHEFEEYIRGNILEIDVAQ